MLNFYFHILIGKTVLGLTETSMIFHCNFGSEQDKWRNINVTAIWGSRQKAKLALKKNSLALKHHDNSMAVSTVLQNEEIVDAKPLAVSNGTTRTNGPKEPLARSHGSDYVNLFCSMLLHIQLWLSKY